MTSAALLVLFCLAGPKARAIQPAATLDVNTIQRLLNQAAAVQIDVERAKTRSEKAKAALKLKPKDPMLNAQLASSEKILKGLVRERDLLRNKAIHRTLTAYGIVPTEGTSGKPKMSSPTNRDPV